MANTKPFSQEIEDNKINERIEAQLLQASNGKQQVIENEESMDISRTNLILNKGEPSTVESTSTGAIPKRGFSYLANTSLSPQSNLNNSSILQNTKPIPRTRNSESKNLVKYKLATLDFEPVTMVKPRCLSNQSIFENTNNSILRDNNTRSGVITPNRNLENKTDFRTSLQFAIQEKVANKSVSQGIKHSTENCVPSTSNDENVDHDAFIHSLECNRNFRNASENINRNGSLVRACKVLRSNLEKQKYLQSSAKALQTSENIAKDNVSLQSDIQNRSDHSNTSKLAQRNAKIIHTQLLLRGLLENNSGFQSAIQPDLRDKLQRLDTSTLRDPENKTESTVTVSQNKESSEVVSSTSTISNEADEERESQPLPITKNVEKSTSNPQSCQQNPSRNSSENITLEKIKDDLNESKTPSLLASSTNVQSIDVNRNSKQKTKDSAKELGIKNAPGKLKPEAFSFLSKLPKGDNTDGRKNLVPTAFAHAETLQQASIKDETSAARLNTEDFPEPSAPPYPHEDYSEVDINSCQNDSESKNNKHNSKVNQEPSKRDDETIKPALPSRPPPVLPEGSFSNNTDSKKKSPSSSMEEKAASSTKEKKEKVKKKFTGLKLSTDLISKPLPPEPKSDQQNPKLTPPPLPPLPLTLVNKFQKRISRELNPTPIELEEDNIPNQGVEDVNCSEIQNRTPLYPSFEAILAVEKPDATNVTNRASNKDLIKQPLNTIHAEDSDGYLLDTGKDFLHQSPPTVPPRKVSQPCIANAKLNDSPGGESPRSSPNSDFDSWMSSIERPSLPQKLKTTQRSLSCNSLVQSFREMSFAMWNAPTKEKRISMDSFHNGRPVRSISKESITKVQTSTANIASKVKKEIPETSPQKLVPIPGFSDSKSQLSRYPWYHDVDAREGQRRLKDFLDQNGAFLIRPSSKKTNEIQHTACMVYSGRIINMHIRQKNNGQYALGFEREGEPTFSSICELIKYYQDYPFESSGQSSSIKSFRACFRVTPPKS